MRSTRELRGTFAAALTPLRGGGAERFDEGAIGPLVNAYVAGGVDGVLALGTTGEGILLTPAERQRAAARFVEAADGRCGVIVHCGAQTTADTAALAADAASSGADGVAVIAPPYFAFDDASLLAHYAEAAAACAPTPFYVYEFAARAGYAVPVAVIERLRERADNLVGLKVSDAPWERFAPYLLDGLDVFVGPEGLIHRGLEAGAVGAVSGLAGAFPELVARVVASPTAEGAAELARVRREVERFPFHAAQKHVLRRRGVTIEEDVRAPLRQLDQAERVALDAVFDGLEASTAGAVGQLWIGTQN